MTSTPAAIGKFELKKEKYLEFNPFFYHYSRSEQSKVLYYQENEKRKWLVSYELSILTWILKRYMYVMPTWKIESAMDTYILIYWIWNLFSYNVKSSTVSEHNNYNIVHNAWLLLTYAPLWRRQGLLLCSCRSVSASQHLCNLSLENT